MWLCTPTSVTASGHVKYKSSQARTIPKDTCSHGTMFPSIFYPMQNLLIQHSPKCISIEIWIPSWIPLNTKLRLELIPSWIRIQMLNLVCICLKVESAWIKHECCLGYRIRSLQEFIPICATTSQIGVDRLAKIDQVLVQFHVTLTIHFKIPYTKYIFSERYWFLVPNYLSLQQYINFSWSFVICWLN